MGWFSVFSFLWIIYLVNIATQLYAMKRENKDRTLAVPHERRYRQTDTQYTVELFMVVDYAAYKWWFGLADGNKNRETETLNLINQYYSYIFSGIDLRFESIDNQPFEIDLGLAGIYVAKSENESEWTSGSTVEQEGQVKGERLMVNSSEALEKFQVWIDENTDLPVFDHAVLFTGTNLTYAGSPGNTGLAFASSMCRNISNSSIVEDSFDYRTITYAAQQIARSLGASDDMDNNDCLEFFNFIMTPKLKLPNKSFPSNRWRFSTCSITYFQEYLDSLNKEQMNCLLDTSQPDQYPPELSALTEELPGKVYDADQQCRHAYGLDSFVCRSEIKTDYKSVCYGLPCYSPRQQSCKLILPADGTPCGDKKLCLTGKCSTSEAADSRLNTCAFGNSPVSNCSGINIDPSLCYLPSIRYDCCGSCENVSLPKKGCEFGDRIASCTLKDCLERGGQYSSVTCCLTCEDMPTPYSPLAADDVISLFATTTPRAGTSKVETSITTTDDTTTVATVGSDGDFSQTTEAPEQVTVTTETVYHSVTDKTFTYGSETSSETSTHMSDAFSETSTVSSFEIIPVSSEILHTRTKMKRSSPMIFTKSVIRTVDPIKSPATVRPEPSSYQAYVDAESTTRGEIAIAIQRFTETDTPVTLSTTQLPYETPSTDPVVKTELSTTASTTEGTYAMTSLTGAAVTATTTPVTPSTLSSVLSTKILRAPATPCPTLPVRLSIKDWGKNLNEINKQFFSKLAIAMKTNQRSVLLGTYGNLMAMYQNVSRGITERQAEEAFSGSNSDAPSFNAADLLQIIRPLWRREKKQILINLYLNIKKLRYKLLALTRTYITRKTTN